jgi:membrane protease YdiL (CAAX protease family)
MDQAGGGFRQIERETDRSTQATTVAQVALALGQTLLLVLLQWGAAHALNEVAKIYLPQGFTAPGWRWGYTGHITMLLVALGIMAVLKPYFNGNFGLRMPTDRHYLWLALWVGLLAGLAVAVWDFYPDILSHHAPTGPTYDTHPDKAVPWFFMQGVFVGITEELPFRALFLGYLLSLWDKSFRLGPIQLSWAAVVTSALFALAHATAFLHEPISHALVQQGYVFLSGLFFAYLFERSKSIIAPIIAHNAFDVVGWSIGFILKLIWG